MFKLSERSAWGPHAKRSAHSMNARTKVRIDSIERAHQALEALPEHQPEEVTKTKAIQRLIAPIRATRSKGYSLAAIGKVLSECGIPITTGALRAYLSEGKPDPGGRSKAKPKRPKKEAKEMPPGPTKGSPEVPAPRAAPPATRPPSAGPSRAVDLDWDPAAPSDKAAAAEARASRAAFTVRPDTKDL
jgi:hypothetical protein